LNPDVFLCTPSVSFWRGFIVLLFFLATRCVWLFFGCGGFDFSWFFYFERLLLFFECSFSLFLCLLLLGLFLQIRLLTSPLLLLLLRFGFRCKFVVIRLASVDNDLLGSLLVGEKVGIPAKKPKDGVEEGVDVALLLDDAHEDAVETSLL